MAKELYIQINPKVDGEIKSVKDLINVLYSEPEDGSYRWNARWTYFDKDLKEVECCGQRRSFEDLLTLSQTYFPETTEEELMKALIDLDIRYIFCSDIHKIVFLRGSSNYKLTERVLQQSISIGYSYVNTDTYSANRLLEVFNRL